VPVPVLGVQLDGEASGVAQRFGRVAAVDDGREADEQRSALALLLEQLRAGVRADRLVADGPVRLEVAVGASAAGMYDPLGDPLAVEVGDLFEEVVVFEDGRAALADGPIVLVVVD